ncbi:hypothetical protein ARMSODRAFT_1028162 [Armillaria solidipes]|uniref:Uncharacterized protein n=1 Tax=Armillaria solidipes TaxID=1076256 RepID=A0A2H3AHU7_9AGAR|nr:hypothetical protein ARMSODRAFT_1028162 [Armillaria solidipes]
MSLDIFLSALGSLGYESCPTEPTLSQRLPGMISLGSQIQNYLTISKIPPLFPRPPPQIQTIPCKANRQVLQLSSPRMSLSHYPTRQDDINTETHVTNAFVARACSYTPVQSQSSSPANFEPADVASTIPDASRSDSPLSSTPSSSSETSLKSQSSTPPIFQPTDVAFTPQTRQGAPPGLSFPDEPTAYY